MQTNLSERRQSSRKSTVGPCEKPLEQCQRWLGVVCGNEMLMAIMMGNCGIAYLQ